MFRSPFAGRRDELIEEICAALAAGASVLQASRRPGMPSYHTIMRWLREDPALKARIHTARARPWQRSPAGREATVRRLEAQLQRGWTLHRACKEPGAPNYYSVLGWGREDPALRQRLRRAQEWGVQFRPHHNHDRFVYDYDKVDRFLARVCAGESVVAMQAAHDAPDQATVRAWRRMRPEFVERYEAAKRAGAAVRRARPRRPFDQAVADRIIVRVTRGETLAALMREAGMPGFTALKRWRRSHPDFACALRLAVKGGQRNRDRARAEPSPALIRRVGRALAAGATIEALCARKDMPSERAFRKWRRRYPAFAEEVAAALDHRDWMFADRAEGLLETGTPEAVAEARRLMARVWRSERGG